MYGHLTLIFSAVSPLATVDRVCGQQSSIAMEEGSEANAMLADIPVVNNHHLGGDFNDE